MSDNCTRRAVLRWAGCAAATTFTGNASVLLATAPAPASTQLTLESASGRSIAVTRWRPARRRGVILFSHGALSAPRFYDLLILPWVAAGYEVWAPLHVDSAAHPDRAAFTGPQGWAARIEDMHVLADHCGARRYVAAGHSYGALVALTLGGASPVPPPGMAGTLADRRAKAVVAFSPPGPMAGLIAEGGYATVAVPALIQTGTRDLPYAAPGQPRDPESWRTHLRAYEEPPAGGGRYALVVDGVDHYFGGAICNFDRPGPRQPAEAAAAAAVARLFMNAYLLSDGTARASLDARSAAAGATRLSRR